ncbi:MAG: hypothetical protein KAX65_15510 [Caldilineaceae bacterium]|nr:hypothetical protein [Caldilineaceae bacterium]
MADLTVDGLGELSSPAANDEIGIWDVSAGQYLKIRRDTLVGGVITGGGTVATGGNTLTVPATGTAALLATANIFTAGQIINQSSIPLKFQAGGVDLVTFYNTGIAFSPYDNGTSWAAFIQIGRNSNASTPAAGAINLQDKNGTARWIWPDGSGNLRVHTSVPTNALDADGTVIGAQTSMAEAKLIAPELSLMADVLDRIAAGADAVRRFVYRDGSFGGQHFEGVITDNAPAYGMDRDAEHPQGKSLNEIQIAGDLLRAVAWLTERVVQLEKLR